jgi:hypothetical protein
VVFLVGGGVGVVVDGLGFLGGLVVVSVVVGCLFGEAGGLGLLGLGLWGGLGVWVGRAGDSTRVGARRR